jgi:hypothetical protein
MNDPVSTLVHDIAAGRGISPGVYGEQVELDATVPGWRFHRRGPDAVRAELGHWFADAGHFDELSRSPLPDGELVTFTLHWEEHGVAHAARQAHVLTVTDGRIVRHTAWCGGRWDAGRLAEMAGA